jgi:hypothetical protein
MSLEQTQPEQLTTREASALIGRSPAAVKSALNRGELPGTRLLDGWRVSRADLFTWHTGTRPSPRRSSRPWEHAADLLAEFGSLSVDELGLLLGRHPGNARKYLAILKAEGRAERLPDRQWVLIKSQAGAA